MSNTWWKDPKELIPEQSGILNIPSDSNILISGPPGSGKTNLLLLRANQLYIGDSPNLFVVVYASTLKSFIRAGSQQYKFPQEKIVTHTHLFRTILQEHGININSSGLSHEQSREQLANKLAQLLDTETIGVPFNALLLDEAQDYTCLELSNMRRLTQVLIATSDSRQKIFEVEDNQMLLKDYLEVHHILKYHFRNGMAICRLADALITDPSYSQMQVSSNYNEATYPSKVAYKKGLGIVEQAKAICEQLKDQLFAYPNEQLGVLCARHQELDQLEAELIKQGLGQQITKTTNRQLFDPEKPIWLCTLSSAKGLEFRAVHIAGLDFLCKMGGAQRRLIYTGVTRAKSALTLYWENNVPGYLEQALRTVQPNTSLVTTNNIFGI